MLPTLLDRSQRRLGGGNHVWNQQHCQQLGLANLISLADGTVDASDQLYDFVPEGPRWLITKDRSEEAYEIPATYHAEGDRDSESVRADMAQMQATIRLELKALKKSCISVLHTAEMRRRDFLSAFLGLFARSSCNTFISYCLGDLLAMISHMSSIFKQDQRGELVLEHRQPLRRSNASDSLQAMSDVLGLYMQSSCRVHLLDRDDGRIH